MSSPTSSNIDPDIPVKENLPGDPDCPRCHGIGYLRQDLPVGHPDFGKVQVCTCRHGQVNQQVRERLFALSRLDSLSHLTFQNFNLKGRMGISATEVISLESAYNTANQFSRTLNGWLLLQGSYGCGKTHLAAAIANASVSYGVPTLFITVPDLLDTLRFAYQNPETTFEQRFDQIRQAPLLILDDFGTQNATEWAKEKLFQIINYRYINHLSTVITTNLNLDEIDERIRSRLEDPELVSTLRIVAPDYRNPAGDMGHHKLSSFDLLRDCTLSTFDLRQNEGLPENDLKSLEKAFQAAQRFAENPHGWLILIGTYGCGKTHLAAGIAHYCADHYKPIFVVVPDLMDHLRATFSPNSTISLDRRFEEVRSAEILILDDLGTQSMTPWTREKLYQLFNHRYNAHLPTVITTATPLEDMDARLRSRLLDRRLCEIYAITAPAYTGAPRSTPKSKTRRKN